MHKSEKIHHGWSIFCTGSSIDRDNNNVSLFNIIETLNVNLQEKQDKKELVIPLQAELVTVWRKDASVKGEVEIRAKMEMRCPDDKVLQNLEYEVKISEEHRNYRFRIKMDKFPIGGPGPHKVCIYKREKGQKSFKKADEVPIWVNIRRATK